jgi:serine protease Do
MSQSGKARSIMGYSIVRWAPHAWLVIRLLALICAAPGIAPGFGPTIAHASGEAEPIAAMVARVSPAVVRVVTVRPHQPADSKAGAQMAKAAANEGTDTFTGSGFIIDPAGYIGTNKHVVEGAISVYVVTADGIRYPAQIVGMPDKADMALIRIEAGRPLPFAGFGDSDSMRPGDRVFAIGSPFGFDTTVTSGIVSALNRDIMESPFDDYIQTDAAINHGNSGGALFNQAGEVIGMTSVIFSPDTGSSGVGFAIPSMSLKFVFDRLMKTGEVRAGMLPIHTQEVTWMLQQALGAPDLQGALVTSVQDAGDKMLQGKIKAGDIVRTINGEPVLDPRDLARKAVRTPIGSDAVLELYRGGATETVHVTMQAWPEVKPVVLDNDGQRTLGLQLASGNGEGGNPIVTVADVEPAGTAANSGIRKGDTIVQVQQTSVSEPDQALQIFGAQSSLKHHFAAVLVRRDTKLSWISLAIPQ